jgi:hypothetical protein
MSVVSLLGAVDEARTTAKAALTLNPDLPSAACASGFSDNPTYLAGRKRLYEGLRLAGVPEG